MTYRVEISPTAIQDIEKIFLWMRDFSLDDAHRWVRGCYEIMLTLEKLPNRCAVAGESQYLGLEIRQLLYRKRFRILFTVDSAQATNGGMVRIHRVLHGAKDRLKKSEQLFGDEES